MSEVPSSSTRPDPPRLPLPRRIPTAPAGRGPALPLSSQSHTAWAAALVGLADHAPVLVELTAAGSVRWWSPHDGDQADPISLVWAQRAEADVQLAGLALGRTAPDAHAGLPGVSTAAAVVATRTGDHWYFARTEEGKQYGVSVRCPVRGPDDWDPPRINAHEKLPGEQVVLDTNAEAAGHDFFSLGGLSVSEDGTWLAFSTDIVGDERYTLAFRNIATGQELAETITGTAGGAIWSRDARYVYYQTVDDAWRPDTVWRHEVGGSTPDVEVFHLSLIHI